MKNTAPQKTEEKPQFQNQENVSSQKENVEKKYPPKTAGSILIKEVPVVSPDDTIKSIIDHIEHKVNWLNSINYVYITDQNNVLTGVISIKELFRKDQATVVSKVMNREIVSVKPETTQERVVYFALKHNLKELPVLDNDGILLGVIPNDKIYSIAYKEAREDLMRFAGYHGSSANLDDVMSLSLFTSLKHRLPWLLIALFGGLLAARIIDIFNPTLQKSIILASFIPLATNITGAVGAQVQVFLIRDLSIHKVDFVKYLIKQSNIVLLIALLISLTFFCVSYLLYGDPLKSFGISTALFCSINSSMFTGVMIPYLFSKVKMDPANASGPIGTIIQDVTTVLIYFTVVSLLL